MDFDDEPQESGVTSVSPSASTQPNATEAAPPKPPRPLSPQQQAENTLKEAFPTVEASVVKAVLMASNYDVERAFHALLGSWGSSDGSGHSTFTNITSLGMTDPSAEEVAAPPKPPRPSAAQRQLEADELYARQLAEHYNRRAPQSQYEGGPPYERSRRGSEHSDEREYSFFDGKHCIWLFLLNTNGFSPRKDDLPVIRENIRKGFLDTQSKVSSWFQTVRKRLDGEEEEGGQSSQGYGTEGYNRSRRSGDIGRRSGDRERYDADPQVLSDDFSALELRDSEGLTFPKTHTRALG